MHCPVQFRTACPAIVLLLSCAALAGHAQIPSMGSVPSAAKGISARQRALFLTPGGLYSAADIRANGGITPYMKYADVMAAHNFDPKVGDRTCPITKTVANPRFKWIVGGKTYTFCCPPCIEEFVARAKTRPASIHPPDDYIKRLAPVSSPAHNPTLGGSTRPATAWTTIGANFRHTGLSPYRGAQNGDIKWSYTTGGNINSSPAIGSDGTLYAGSYDNNIYALAPDGAVKWKFPTGGVVTASPALAADGTIYDGSANGILYALHPDGTLKWKYVVPFNSLTNSPTVAPDGTIYLGVTGDELYAIHPDGTLKWKVPDASGFFGSPAIGGDGTIYSGSADHQLYATTPEGVVRWKTTLGGMVTGSPAVDSHGVIYVGCSDFNLYAFSPGGVIKWKFHTGGPIYSTPALGADGTIYLGSGDGWLYALTPAGAVRWKIQVGPFRTNSPVLGADGTIYAGTTTLWAISHTGKELWKIPMGEDTLLSSPAIGATGALYAGGNDGKVYAIE